MNETSRETMGPLQLLTPLHASITRLKEIKRGQGVRRVLQLSVWIRIMWSHCPFALGAVLPGWPDVIKCSESSYCMTPTRRALPLLPAVPFIIDEE